LIFSQRGTGKKLYYYSKFEMDKSERIMAVPRRAGNGRQIETAVFFDHVAYNRFSAIYNDDEIEEMVLAYVNQVDTSSTKYLHI
jgi:hypothetical protein